MQIKKLYFLLFVFLMMMLNAQNKELTVEEIFSGAFRLEHLQDIRSLRDGKTYTVLHSDAQTQETTLCVYDYRTQRKLRVLVSSKELPKGFTFRTYQLDKKEQKVLLGGDIQPIYRRSFSATYYVFDLKTRKAELVFDRRIQEPVFSPDGSYVAFSFDNDLYIKSLKSSEVRRITFDGKKNEIINGTTDWVYEEEFGFVRAFQWSQDSRQLAFIRFDERKVPEFSMDIYGKSLYPQQQVFKYPKAGEENSKVSVWIHEVTTSRNEEIALQNAYYIPRIQWNENTLYIQTLNRRQNELNLFSYKASTRKIRKVLTEKDAAYVELSPQIEFLKDGAFLWLSERDGRKHIYLYRPDEEKLRQVTKGDWEVTRIYGHNSENHRIYYQSTEMGAIRRGVYSISYNGSDKQLLTPQLGVHQAYFSADFSYFIDQFSNAQTPVTYTLFSTLKKKPLKVLVENSFIKEKLNSYKLGEKSFSTLKVNGNQLNMYMIKPWDFDPNKKYPLLMFQYSGPGSQQVSDTWFNTNDYWHQLLAEKGYVVVCVDGRGTGFMGRDFKKVTQYQLGKYETQDQIDAAKELAKLPYIDAQRIGIWGWSFGGFLSTNALLKGNDVFRMAIAVAPVTNWRFYDTIYTERYMGVPRENPQGYDMNSPLFFADQLKGKYLIVHGSADDNVHLQNTMRMVEELLQQNKDFQWCIYPDKDHGIYGGNTRIHLYNQMTRFVLNNL